MAELFWFHMSFEIKEKDLLARIGKLKTKSGTVETPLLFPVINPSIQPIRPQRLKDHFGFEAIITNSYILKKRFDKKVSEIGIHKFLDYDGAIMTDSGAYQILVYGGVEVNQTQIVNYQELIGTDIATILDIPTGWHVPKEKAKETVAETLKRAKAFFKIKKREDLLWVGPVQGGRHLDLVKKSSEAMGKLPFQIHALGSPTEVMEGYRYDVLADMILTAKMNLPAERPFHLFGAGHPSMFALASALGCDLFDSAAYALYARENRYMTENGTWRLNELEYFPCQCPKCSSITPQVLLEAPKAERVSFLAEHNLYVCIAELRRIKQAIRDGRLWEHVEMRAHSHPALHSALKKIKGYEKFIEKYSPCIKKSGLFFFDPIGLSRPEVVHYREKLRDNYTTRQTKISLLLFPQTRTKPFHKSYEFKETRKALNSLEKDFTDKIEVCFYSAPFGIVPLELDEAYPLSQNEVSVPNEWELIQYIGQQTIDFIKRTDPVGVIFFESSDKWEKPIQRKVKAYCKTNKTRFIKIEEGLNSKTLIHKLQNLLSTKQSEKND